MLQVNYAFRPKYYPIFFIIILYNQSDIDLDNMQLLCEEQMEQQSLFQIPNY